MPTANADSPVSVVLSGNAGTLDVEGTGIAGTPAGGVVSVQGVTSGTPIPVTGVIAQDTSSTVSNSNVNSSASSVTVLAAAAGRNAASVYNDSTQILYLNMKGDTASATNYTVQLASGDYFEFPQPIYVGLVTGIWASADGAARVSEYT